MTPQYYDLTGKALLRRGEALELCRMHSVGKWKLAAWIKEVPELRIRLAGYQKEHRYRTGVLLRLLGKQK